MKTPPVQSPLIVTEEGTTLVDDRGVKVLEMVISPALPIAQARRTAARLAAVYNHHAALVRELEHAGVILDTLLHALTPAQTTRVAKQLAASSASPDDITRADARRVVLDALDQ